MSITKIKRHFCLLQEIDPQYCFNPFIIGHLSQTAYQKLQQSLRSQPFEQVVFPHSSSKKLDSTDTYDYLITRLYSLSTSRISKEINFFANSVWTINIFKNFFNDAVDLGRRIAFDTYHQFYSILFVQSIQFFRIINRN